MRCSSHLAPAFARNSARTIKVLDELRFERAKNHTGEQTGQSAGLPDTWASVKPSDFRHAFQHWSGVPPTLARKGIRCRPQNQLNHGG
jgi:AraC-like DNA-binding protein